MDFTGTGCEIRGNLNAPESVVHSAIIYCMRSMLDTDIPLNAGCLVPLQSVSSDDFEQLNFLPFASKCPQRIAAFTIKNSCGLWRERVDLSENRRRCTQGIPRLCRQPRLHQVGYKRGVNPELNS